MKTFKSIECKIESRVGRLSLNRPEKHNAMDALMISEIRKVISLLAKDAETRVIYISGKGKSFSSGADLSYMKEQADMSFEENVADANNLALMFYEIFTCPKPVITFSHGNITGGANGIVAASDFAITLADSTFRFSEVKLGLIPATISPYVVDRIGRARAMELLLSGRSFTGYEAEKFNLVNKCTESSEAENVVDEMIDAFRSSAPGALVETKKLLLSLTNISDRESYIDKTSRLIAGVRSSNEGKEGLNAFFEKRKPYWSDENF